MRLILIRHAKSSWGDPYADDHDRVLNKRGQASAAAIGTWLAEHRYLPEVILCSDAARTTETAERIMLKLPESPQIRFSRDLYLAEPETMLAMAAKETAGVVAMIGHNPGIGLLANALVTTPPAHTRFVDYPTCATTIIDFANELSGKGHCVDFTVPRDLIGVTG